MSTPARARGTTPRVRARRDAILAQADHPLTMREILAKVGGAHSSVYADLRVLSGSHLMRYDQHTGAVNHPGFPVIWNTWQPGDGYVTFDLTAEARQDLTASVDLLERVWDLPAADTADGEDHG